MSVGVGFWIGLPIGPGHVTVCIRHGCSADEVDHFKEVLHREIEPLLPIMLIIKRDVIMRGYKNDVPTLDVEIIDGVTRAKLEDIYRRNYQQIDGHTAYPELAPHITVDKPDVMQFIETCFARIGGAYMTFEATLKRVGDKTVIDVAKK